MPQTSATLFDLAESKTAKVAGMSQAEANKASLLRFARAGLVKIAQGRLDGEVTADDAQRFLFDNGISVHALGNAAGSLFRGKQWEWTGRYAKSSRAHAHANELKVWRLKDLPAV